MMKLWRALRADEAFRAWKGGKVYPSTWEGSPDSDCPEGQWSFWFSSPRDIGGRVAWAVTEVEVEDIPYSGTMRYRVGEENYQIREYALNTAVDVEVVWDGYNPPGTDHQGPSECWREIEDAESTMDSQFMAACELIGFIFDQNEKEEGDFFFTKGDEDYLISPQYAQELLDQARGYLTWCESLEVIKPLDMTMWLQD